MNKKILITLAIIIILITLTSGGFIILNSNQMPEDKMMMQKDAMKQEDKMMDADKPAMDADEKSRYIEYSSSSLDNTLGKKILFFYASWCPTCRPADQEFSSRSNEIPEGVTLIRVNYNDPDTDDEEKVLAKKYGITYQHTFVQIDENGNEIAKWNGGGIDELMSNIK